MKRNGHRLIENVVNMSQGHLMFVYKIMHGLAWVGRVGGWEGGGAEALWDKVKGSLGAGLIKLGLFM